jgi:hypothetical protein
MLGDSLICRSLAGGGEGAPSGRDVSLAPIDHPAVSAKATDLVEDRSANATLCEREERLGSSPIEAFRSLAQPDHRAAVDVVGIDHPTVMAHESARDVARDVDMILDQPTAFLRFDDSDGRHMIEQREQVDWLGQRVGCTRIERFVFEGPLRHCRTSRGLHLHPILAQRRPTGAASRSASNTPRKVIAQRMRNSQEFVASSTLNSLTLEIGSACPCLERMPECHIERSRTVAEMTRYFCAFRIATGDASRRSSIIFLRNVTSNGLPRLGFGSRAM